MSQQTTYSLQPAIGYTGTLDYKRPHSLLTVKNTEASAAINFGIAVKRKSAATTDLDVVLPAAESDEVLGIVIRSQTYAPAWTDLNGNTHGQLSASGIVPNALMLIALSGRMLVACRSGCTAGDRLWVRAVSGGGAEYLGALEDADDSTDMIDCTAQGRWMTSASADGLAWLEFDFTNK